LATKQWDSGYQIDISYECAITGRLQTPGQTILALQDCLRYVLHIFPLTSSAFIQIMVREL